MTNVQLMCIVLKTTHCRCTKPRVPVLAQEVQIFFTFCVKLNKFATMRAIKINFIVALIDALFQVACERNKIFRIKKHVHFCFYIILQGLLQNLGSSYILLRI